MTKQLLLTVCAAAVLLQAGVAGAQDQFKLSFQSICRTVNDNGRIVSRSLNERDIIRACMDANGIASTNWRQMKLVYNRGADYTGDLIQVVRGSNNVVVCTAFKVLFQKSVASANGATVERLGFLYNGVHSDAIGSTTFTEQNYARQNGSARTVLTGKMQFWDEVYHPNAICTANWQARQ